MLPAFIADRENRKRRGTLETENRIGAEISTQYDDFVDDETDDEFVLETKGSSPPPPASPMEEAQAQIELERQRAEFARQETERANAQAAQEKAAKIERARGVQQQAYGQATDYGTQQSGARGYDAGLVDQYGLLDLYNSSIDNARMGITEDDTNPFASYNTKSAFNDAAETARGTYRGDLRKQLNSIAGDGFQYNAFADTADDSILSAILGEHRSDAQAQIDQAKARGQLNDVGYGRANSRLGNQSETAMADLQDLGMGVLSGYRDQLSGLRDNTMTSIDQADFNSPLNFDSFQTRLDQTKNDLNGRMRGDIFRATDGQTFFDPAALISSSGAIQGFYNPTNATNASTGVTANPLLDAFTQGTNTTNTNTNGVF